MGLASCDGKGQLPAAADNKSLLWEVSGKDLQKPAYIFGTMHLLCSSDAALSENLKAVITSSDEIYFEVDMDDLGQLMTGLSAGKMKHDTTLADLYTPEEYNRVKTFFDAHQLGPALMVFKTMQPMLVSALVYQVSLPCTEADGMEMNIMKLAHTQKKEIKGLETVAFQASVLEKIPYKQQAQELLNSIDSVDATKKESDEMVKLYKEQDLDKLLDYSLKSDGGTTSDVQDVMINDRNRNWAEQFATITKGKQVLIAVGAGHLGGKAGLLQLLKEKGYRLRAVQN